MHTDQLRVVSVKMPQNLLDASREFVSSMKEENPRYTFSDMVRDGMWALMTTKMNHPDVMWSEIFQDRLVEELGPLVEKFGCKIVKDN